MLFNNDQQVAEGNPKLVVNQYHDILFSKTPRKLKSDQASGDNTPESSAVKERIFNNFINKQLKSPKKIFLV